MTRVLAGRLLAAVFLLVASAVPSASQLALAAAADLQPVLPETGARFQRATGPTVTTT